MPLKLTGRIVLGLLLGATLWLAVTAAPRRVPAPGVETTLWLAAHSVAFDHDERFVDADVARYRARFGEGPRDVRTEPHGDRLSAPFLAVRLWAAALAVGGESGPFLLNFLALTLAALAACRALRAPLGDAVALWVALLLFGSVAWNVGLRWQSEILVMAAVVLAMAAIWGREPGLSVVEEVTGPDGEKRVDEIYGGDLETRAAHWPWPVAGLLLGAAAVRHPGYALLALPVLAELPTRFRGSARLRAGALFVLLFVAPIVAVALLHGAPWEAPANLFDARLFGWNALYFAAGRNVGLLVGYLPLLALLFSPRSDGGRRFLPLTVLLAVVLQLVIAPFDWAGDPSAVGNVWFLPLYGALWFCAGPMLRPRGIALLAIAAAPFLSALWLAPLSDGTRPPAAFARISPFTSGVREHLPFETSLRTLPGSDEIARAGVRLRGTHPEIHASSGRLSWLALEGARREIAKERRAELIVESDRELSSVRLDFSADAPASLAVEGGVAGGTTFRPSGEVAFEITLPAPARRHPLWWSRAPVSIYFLGLALPQPKSPAAGSGTPAPASADNAISFDLGLARVRGSEGLNHE
ncbi:MAG: hypothetical protein ABI639_05940 [Thermoanaerobaculia bacterium]